MKSLGFFPLIELGIPLETFSLASWNPKEGGVEGARRGEEGGIAPLMTHLDIVKFSRYFYSKVVEGEEEGEGGEEEGETSPANSSVYP